MTARDELLHRDRIVVIFRGQAADRCLDAAQALHEAGLRWFEVTMNTRDAAATITRLRKELPEDTRVGAGTVVTAASVRAARDAGASFVISPHVDEDIITHAHDEGMLAVPGAFTATEIVRAQQGGADLVKVFPIRPVGADYIRQLRGPFNDIPFLVSGGVDARLARECFDAGAEAVGVGLHLFGEGTTEKVADGLAAAGRRFLETTGLE